MYHYKIPFSELELTTEIILSEMGYNDQVPAGSEVVQMVNSLLGKISTTTYAESAFAIYTGEVSSSSAVSVHNTPKGEITLEVGSTIAGLMSGIDSICIFAATAGINFEKFQNELKEDGDLIQSFIADQIGSCIAERAGDIAERHLMSLINPKQHTHRFSPGYCGWHLSQQQIIFSMLDPGPCGIILSDVSLMLPIKSISGIIGIGCQVNQKQYGCQFCELETCYKRKTKKS